MKKNFGIIIVLFIGFLPLIPLFHPGLPITHDGKDHVARIANFYISLSEGNLIPRWGALLNWGFGHPILMFLYPFSSYTASFFHFLGFSLSDSVKIVFGLGFIASGITMYLWVKEELGEYMGIAAALLYMYAPYRFVDLYVRGAIGEHMAFIFPPLILYFLLKYFKKNSYLRFVGISISMALLLLSHNAISIMFLPLIFFYLVYLYYQKRDLKKLFFAILGLFFGFFLSAFFIIPAFFEGKYTLRDIVTGNEYKDRFVMPLQFIWGKWSYGITGQFTVQLGILQWIGVMLSPFVFVKLYRKNKKYLILVFIVLLLVSLFLQIAASQFVYEIFTVLKKFQFPWRFLSLTVFTTSVLGGSVLLLIRDKYKKIAVGVLIVLAITLNLGYMKANGYLNNSDSFYESIYYSTTDTGESSPIWSVRFMEKEAKSNIEVIGGTAIVEKSIRSTTSHSYIINALSDSRIKDNTVYFPGWTVYVDGVKTSIEFQDPSERGLITFNVPKGKHKVEVIFENTKLRTFSNIISTFSLLILLGTGIYLYKKNEK